MSGTKKKAEVKSHPESPDDVVLPAKISTDIARDAVTLGLCSVVVGLGLAIAREDELEDVITNILKQGPEIESAMAVLSEDLLKRAFLKKKKEGRAELKSR
jgi:hypothetical protein